MVREFKFPLCQTSELCCNRSIANFQEKALFQWFGRLRDGTARADGRVGKALVRDLTDCLYNPAMPPGVSDDRPGTTDRVFRELQ